MERTSGGPAVVAGYRQERDEFGLTKREREVRALLAEGLNQPEVGERLNLSKQRVHQIVGALMNKGAVREEDGNLVIVIKRK